VVRINNFGSSRYLNTEFYLLQVQCRQTLQPLNRLGCVKCYRLALKPKNIVWLLLHVKYVFLNCLWFVMPFVTYSWFPMVYKKKNSNLQMDFFRCNLLFIHTNRRNVLVFSFSSKVFQNTCKDKHGTEPSVCLKHFQPEISLFHFNGTRRGENETKK
jgi:hypothetical protein